MSSSRPDVRVFAPASFCIGTSAVPPRVGKNSVTLEKIGCTCPSSVNSHMNSPFSCPMVAEPK